jgi:UDP-3-O-[3-hydroxymyristoyl] glucosamine N-acyltransferase
MPGPAAVRPSLAKPDAASGASAHTAGSIAASLSARLVGNPALVIDNLESMDRAGHRTLTFIRDAQYAADWPATKAAAALVTEGIEVPGHDAAARALLFVPDADLALAKVLELFAPKAEPPAPGIHPSAVVDAAARIDGSASIGPSCTVGPGTVIDAGAVLIANVSVGRDARIGRGTVLHPMVMVGDRCRVGAACIIHGGVIIGADGFGYRPDPAGKGLVKIPHIGHVEIGDAVEVGANSCIDRAKFGATVIGSGTKIDNLVQVAHNCRVGRACLICGTVSLAGSAEVGDGVIIAGGVGVGDHRRIGSGARVGARSSVLNDIPAGETWLGEPALPSRQAAANYAAFRNLSDLARTVKKLQKRLDDFEAGRG